MCGGKGSQTVNQNQTYTPNPVAGQAITNALGQVQNVSQTPFQTPVAPVQGFSNDQQRAFDLTNQAQGSAQGYFDKAASYFSPSGISQFFNPMSDNVMRGMQDIFGSQMKQTTSNLIGAAGGAGAGRIGVAQANLARQQDLAAGQTMSDMYNRAAQQAQGAAFGLGSLGPAVQNSALQGAQALLGTGGLQQQLGQAQLNAPYQNLLQQIMWPYQNAQFNATNTAALAPGLGGTTAGQTTYPAASPWGSIIGAGAAGLGAFGGAGGFSGFGGQGGGGYNQYNPEPFGANADTDPSLIGARGGRVPERADGGAVDAADDPYAANAMMAGGYAEGGAPDDNPDDLGGMVSTHPLEGAGGDLIPHQQIQPIKPNIPQLPQAQQSGGGGGGSDWTKAATTAAQMAMMFINRGGRVNPRYADGGGVGGLMSMVGNTGGLLSMLQNGKPMGLMSALDHRGDDKDSGALSKGSPLGLLGLPGFAVGGQAQDPSQGGAQLQGWPTPGGAGGFGTGKGGLMSMMGGSGAGGMGGLVRGMMNSSPPSAASVAQGMMSSPPPPMSSVVGRMFQGGNRGMPGGFGNGGLHAFDPRSYMQPRQAARGGSVGFADGGAPDELIPPPYDAAGPGRAMMPNTASLLAGEKEPPPPQIEGAAPGKVRSFEDPRLMGAIPELAGLAAPMMPAGEIAGMARPATTIAREALERAPGIVNRAVGKPAERFGNPLPHAGLAAAGTLGGSTLAEAQSNTLSGGPTPDEKAEIGVLETRIGTLDTEIAGLRRRYKDDELFNTKSAKARGDRERAQKRLDLVNGNVETRRKRLEDVEFGQQKKTMEAEEPFRLKHKEFANDLPMYSMAGAGGTGLLSGLLNKGKMLKPVGSGILAGGAEGALTSMGPSLYDMGNLPLKSKYQKEASDQIWGPVDRGDYSFYKNRVAGDALLNAGISGTAAAIGSYGPKLLGKAGQYARAMMASRAASGAAAPIEGAVAKAAPAMEEAAASTVKKPTKMIVTEHTLADGITTVKRYVNPNNPKDVRWYNPKAKSWFTKENYPKLEAEKARGGRISGNPYFADGGDTSSFDDRWSDVDNAVERGIGNGGFDPGSSGSYFGDEAKAARNFIPTPRPRPEMPDEGGDVSPVAFAGRRPPMGMGQMPQSPSLGGGNPYGASGASAPQQGAPQGGGKFIDSPWAALMNAGLGIMAASGKRDSRGLPTPTLSAIGEGGMQGMQMLGAQRDAAMKQQTVDQASRRLQQQADFHADNYNKLTMAQKVQLMRPVKIGQDRYGREIYGLPKLGATGEFTGEVTPLDASGRPEAGAAAPGKTPVEQQQMTPQERLISAGLDRAEVEEQSRIPVMAQLAAEERNYQRPGVVPEALEGLNPADARMVKAIADGRQKFLSINGRNAAYNRQIMEKVHEYDPAADETTFARRQRTTNFFAVGTQGGGGQNIAAMNTWAQHVDEYLNLSKELDLGRFKSWNEAYNWMTEHGYTKEKAQVTLGKLQGAAKAVADEGAKVFAGSNSALADRQAWHDYFDPSTPKKVAVGKAQEVEKLVEGRLNAVANQYNEGMRTGHDPLNFVSPKTREVLKRLQSEDPYAGKGSAQPQQPQQPAGQEGQMKQFKQGWGIFRDGKWQPYTQQGPTQ